MRCALARSRGGALRYSPDRRDDHSVTPGRQGLVHEQVDELPEGVVDRQPRGSGGCHREVEDGVEGRYYSCEGNPPFVQSDKTRAESFVCAGRGAMEGQEKRVGARCDRLPIFSRVIETGDAPGRMMALGVVLNGTVNRSSEHWIDYLRVDLCEESLVAPEAPMPPSRARH